MSIQIITLYVNGYCDKQKIMLFSFQLFNKYKM